MIEREPREGDDLLERLIPEIPGVEQTEDDPELGALGEESDEESQEDVLEGMGKEIRQQLSIFGVEGLGAATQAEIVQLWERMDMSRELITDLVLYATSDIQKISRNELAKPLFKDLKERSEISENPYDIRRNLIELTAPNLMKLGYGRLDAYRLPRSSKPDLALAFKVEGWLLGQFFMDELPQQIKHAVATSPEQKIDRAIVFRMTKDEILRQARIVDSDETRKTYDLRLISNTTAHEELQKSLKNAYRIAEFAFSKHLSQ